MPVKEDYYRQLAIRTGSKDYSQKIIARGWLKMGWCGIDDEGLRRQSDSIGKKGNDGKTHWKLVNKNGQKPPAWQSEKEFFNWLGVKYLPPEEREVQKTESNFLAK
jgi:DNA polymerase/3'-5' exonuclease PolX